MIDSLWGTLIIALLYTNKNYDSNRLNYLDKYKKYGDDENV